jgi:non-canonical (house-cleaning) NTP pyrophosphatase
MQNAEIVNVAVVPHSTQGPAAADTLDTAQSRVTRAASAADSHHRIAADELAEQPRHLRL